MTPPSSDQDESPALETARLFIAIPLPEEILKAVARLQEALKKGFQFTPCRPAWVSTEIMHLTLRFLGPTDASKIAPLSEALAAAAARHEPLTLTPRELGVFPDWRRPRVLWVGLREKSGGLERLQGEIESIALAHGAKPSETPFHPHLTLARFKSMKGIAAAREIVASHRQFSSNEFRADGVILFQSKLGSEGARHLPILKVLLGARTGAALD